MGESDKPQPRVISSLMVWAPLQPGCVTVVLGEPSARLVESVVRCHRQTLRNASSGAPRLMVWTDAAHRPAVEAWHPDHVVVVAPGAPTGALRLLLQPLRHPDAPWWIVVAYFVRLDECIVPYWWVNARHHRIAWVAVDDSRPCRLAPVLRGQVDSVVLGTIDPRHLPHVLRQWDASAGDRTPVERAQRERRALLRSWLPPEGDVWHPYDWGRARQRWQTARWRVVCHRWLQRRLLVDLVRLVWRYVGSCEDDDE